MEATATHTRSTVIPGLRYKDAHAAIDWLCHVLGFTKHVVYPGPDNTVGHAELALNGGMIMLGTGKDDEYGKNFKSPVELGFETSAIYVVVPDADAVWARAQAAGAPVLRAIMNTDYGSREFTIRDPEGHSWSVGTYDPWAAQAG
jgi:uncharacterized glyoxalase superfamily protein PhnB